MGCVIKALGCLRNLERPELLDTSITIQRFDELGVDPAQMVLHLKVFGDLLPRPLSNRTDLDAYAKKIMQKAEVYFAVVDGHKVAGMMALYANDTVSHNAYLTLMSILPQFQGKGLGRIMVRRAIAVARKKDMASMSLEVDQENLKAQSLYKSLGFILLERSGVSWTMRARLDATGIKPTSYCTPLYEIPTLAAAFNLNVDLRIKRDDLYPQTGGGNKSRKMQYLVEAARKGGHDSLVTNGGLQSNHARAAALTAAEQGLHCCLILHCENDDPPSTGNLMLMRLAGAEIEFCHNEQLGSAMDTAMNRMHQRGFNPMYIWGGGHCLEGSLAYYDAAQEAQKQCDSWTPDVVILASGTGTTQAGLIAGYADLSAHVLGVSIARPKERGASVVRESLEQLCDHLGRDSSIMEVDFRDEWTCGGYEKTSDELFNCIDKAARYGLILDPTYTGKAFLGLTAMIASGEIKHGSRVLFWHTGGLMNLLTNSDYMRTT